MLMVMREFSIHADDSPAPEPDPKPSSPLPDAPEKPTPEEYPIVEPAGPFKLPQRAIPQEPPKKTVPFTPAPTRFIPRPEPARREIQPNSPHRMPRRRAA